MTVKLNPEPRRVDLTVRELVSIIGGLIGGLCQNATTQNVRDAVQWWAEQDEIWLPLDGDLTPEMEELLQRRLDKLPKAKSLRDLLNLRTRKMEPSDE